MSKYDKLKKLFPKDILNQVDTAEKAVALKGADRKEYLEALEQVYGDKNKRAKDMGFGDRTWYHGSTVPIDKFQTEALGKSTGAQSAKKGFFFAEDPSTASDYADLAREKGIIREGDKVTTKWESETADITDLDKEIRSKQFDYNSAYQRIDKLKKDRLQSLDGIEQRISDLNKIKDKGSKEYKELKEYIDYKKSNIDKTEKTISKFESELKPLKNEVENLVDKNTSTGQQVLPVRLKGNPDSIHVKDYKGRGYRDTTYADELTNMDKQGKDAALFRNTYDPADPNNRVKQDIAVVTKPNQVRSTNAAFDPRFKDSDLILAANKKAPESVTDLLKNIGSKGLDALSYPQRKMFKAIAEQMGVNGNIDNSESSSRAIVEKLASMVGIPEDSNLGNAAKALGVAGMEVFADPTNVIPINKITQGAKAVKKIFPALDNLGGRLKDASKIANNSNEITSKFGKIINTINKTPVVADKISYKGGDMMKNYLEEALKKK